MTFYESKDDIELPGLTQLAHLAIPQAWLFQSTYPQGSSITGTVSATMPGETPPPDFFTPPRLIIPRDEMALCLISTELDQWLLRCFENGEVPSPLVKNTNTTNLKFYSDLYSAKERGSAVDVLDRYANLRHDLTLAMNLLANPDFEEHRDSNTNSALSRLNWRMNRKDSGAILSYSPQGGVLLQRSGMEALEKSLLDAACLSFTKPSEEPGGLGWCVSCKRVYVRTTRSNRARIKETGKVADLCSARCMEREKKSTKRASIAGE